MKRSPLRENFRGKKIGGATSFQNIVTKESLSIDLKRIFRSLPERRDRSIEEIRIGDV